MSDNKLVIRLDVMRLLRPSASGIRSFASSAAIGGIGLLWFGFNKNVFHTVRRLLYDLDAETDSYRDEETDSDTDEETDSDTDEKQIKFFY